MKKIILLLFLFTVIGRSQNDTYSFLVQIPNSNYIPKVTHTRTGERINSLKTQNNRLNTLIGSYEIYSVEKVFKNTKKAALKNTYLVVCNDLKLMNELQQSFSNFYYHLENANGETLEDDNQCPLPNDFGTTGGHIEAQEELNYIRAPETWCNLTKGSNDVVIGVVDSNVIPDHEDLKNKMEIVKYGNIIPDGHNHGIRVASVAAAQTGNGLGMSAIGYNSKIYSAVGWGSDWPIAVDELSQLPGVKVINASWDNPYNPNGELYDEVVNDRGVVVVAAAGNNTGPAASAYIKPAAFKDVISVSSIGHEDRQSIDQWGNESITQKDHHQFLYKAKGMSDFIPTTQQHNDSVDIVAPGLRIVWAGLNNDNSPMSYGSSGGTSYAAPMVSGTVALMFDLNYCLKPKEIESILKLTAVKIDNLPQNQQWYGQLGAGKLDAYEAVKMAKDMADPFGKVEVKDRILYRWFYKLVTAPYEIEMTNNDVTGNARLKFKARNNITIKSGRYYPQAGGRVNLSIDKDLVLDDCPPRPPIDILSSENDKVNNSSDLDNSLFEVYPTLFNKDITVSKKGAGTEDMDYIIVYDILGKIVSKRQNIDVDKVKLNLEYLQSGIYLVKIFNRNGKNIDLKKIVKN